MATAGDFRFSSEEREEETRTVVLSRHFRPSPWEGARHRGRRTCGAAAMADAMAVDEPAQEKKGGDREFMPCVQSAPSPSGRSGSHQWREAAHPELPARCADAGGLRNTDHSCWTTSWATPRQSNG